MAVNRLLATPQVLYDANIPAVESLAAAKHFKLGPVAYEKEGYSPWKHPITGPFYRVGEAPLLSTRDGAAVDAHSPHSH